MNRTKLLFSGYEARLGLGAVLLAFLTGCAGFVDELRAGFSAPSSGSAGPGEYVNYPGYGIVYVAHPRSRTDIEDDDAFDAVEEDAAASGSSPTARSIAPGAGGGTAATPVSASPLGAGTRALVIDAPTPPPDAIPR